MQVTILLRKGIIIYARDVKTKLLYLSDGIFDSSRLDESFVEAPARNDRVFKTFSFILLDVLRSLSFHTETQS